MVHKIWSSLDSWAASQAESAQSAAALRQIYQVQANLIINNNGEVKAQGKDLQRGLIFLPAPVAELFYNTGWPS